MRGFKVFSTCRIIFCSVIALFFMRAAFVMAADVGGFFNQGTPVEVTADYLSYDKETETYHARGNVLITQEGTTLKTGAAVLNMGSGAATTSGRVTVVDREGNTLEGENLEFNIKEKTAVVAKGRLFFKRDNAHIDGDILRKTGPESYEGAAVSYTTCDCTDSGERPAWSFSASGAKINMGEYLTGKNAFFRIKGVPLLYSPYISLPIKKGRQTGLLMPKPGFSELKGFALGNAFFWAISRNMDATLYLDVETSRGVGEGLEYRYIRTRESYGEFYFYHFGEDDMDRVRTFRQDVDNLARPESAGTNRWQLKLAHTEIFSRGFNVKADVNIVSDDEYFIDFGQGSDRSIESLESNVSISKNWSVYSLVAQLRIFDNLLVENDVTTLRKLPEITFTAADQKVFSTPFYVSLNSSFINFSRDEGTTGQRLDLQPKLSLPLSPGGYFDFNTSVTPRGTFYLVKETSNGRYIDRYLYDVTSEITTTFARIYFTDLKKIKAFKHTLRPKLSYTYIPEAVQDNLPDFDSVDAVAASNTVTYSLNSILTGKYFDGGQKVYHDYVYFEISQNFNINEATRKLTSSTDERRPFSDISAELILKPTTWSSITGRGNYNVYDDMFANYDSELAVNDSRGDALSVSRRFVRDDADFIEGAVKAHVSSALDISYSERFSLDEGKSIERQYVASYTHQCWGAELTFSDKIEEKVVYLTFNLRGLGKVAGFQGALSQ